MKRLKVLGYFVVILHLGLLSGVSAADTITTFITNSSEPYFSTTQSSEGRANKIMQLISEQANVKYRIHFMPLKRVVSMQAPFVIGDPDIFRDQRRRAVFPIDVIRSAFFYDTTHNNKLNFKDISSLSGKTMGVLRGSLEDASFFENNNIHVEPSDSIDSLFRKLMSHRIDFCILLKESGDYTIQKNYADHADKFLSEVVPGSYIPISIMVDKDSNEGKALIRKYQHVIFDVINSQQVKDIIDDYYQSDEDSRKHHQYLNFFINHYQGTWFDDDGDR